jgi:hypothetical protein
MHADTEQDFHLQQCLALVRVVRMWMDGWVRCGGGGGWGGREKVHLQVFSR